MIKDSLKYNIKDILQYDNNIQYSINLEMDYKKENKLKEYIHTYKSVEIINEVLCSFKSDTTKNKSKIIIGPYGKGKSYLALYIMNLINDNNRKQNKYYNSLLDKAKELDNKVYLNIKAFINSDERYLPVVLNSNIYDKGIDELFIYSLKQALELNDLDEIELDFYFEKAIDKIERWKLNYKETFKKFKDLIDRDINIFIKELKSYNSNTYKQFKKVYKEIMSGEEFNPYYEINLINTYIDASKKIKKAGYTGIYVLCDEFSKYMEYLIAKDLILDVKKLQDFAELCNRSNKDYNINLLLISHKSITQYINNIDNSNNNTWKTIEGRFDQIQYNEFTNEQYEIIASAIKKDQKLWTKYKNANKEKFEMLEDNIYIRNLFKGMSDMQFKKWIIEGAYPLTPIAAYTLPHVSEKIAQNERTLFSFLGKNDENSLKYFVQKGNEEIKLDCIYDYFENSILNSGLNDKFVDIVKDTKDLIKTFKDEKSKSILKTIAIVYVINNFSELKPDRNLIKELYGENGLLLIDKLIIENCLFENKYDSTLEIVSHERTEIFYEIKEARNRLNNNKNINSVLNKLVKNLFLEAKIYNDEHNIFRYFKVKFIDNSSKQYILQDLKNKQEEDGIIYITEQITDIEFEGKESQAILIKNKIPQNIKEIILDLDAINYIKNKNSNLDELNSLELQYEKRINEYLNTVLNLENNNIVIKNTIKRNDVRNKRDLSKLVSESMEELYPLAVKINNEMINKTNLSSAIVKARKNIIDMLLNYNNEKQLYLKKGSAETTILRAIFINRGLIPYDSNHNYFDIDTNLSKLNTKEDTFLELLTKIEDMILSSNTVNILKLYDLCMSSENGFGLKRGVIPIVITWVISKYKNCISIKDDEQIYDLSGQTLDLVDKNPEKYSITLIKNNYERMDYINKLSNLFMDKEEILENRNSNLSYVTKSIKYWFLSLNKYTKDVKKIYIGNGKYEKISKEIVKFKNKIRTVDERSIEFLFEDLPQIFSCNNYYELLHKIEHCKNDIEQYSDNLYKNIEIDIKNIFDIKPNESLNNGMYKWLKQLELKEIIPSKLINNFINMILNNKDNNYVVNYVDNLSNTILGIYLSDWNDNTAEEMLIKLKDIKQRSIELGRDTKPNNEDINIKKQEEIILSRKAEMLLDDLRDTFEEYGDSINIEEKKYIIVELLKEIQ